MQFQKYLNISEQTMNEKNNGTHTVIKKTFYNYMIYIQQFSYFLFLG